METAYSIRAVANKTGLSAHTIRAWEKRYKVLDPERTSTNRRVYGDADVARLQLLRRAVAAGHSIGLIARLDDGELEGLASTSTRAPEGKSDKSALDFCRQAIRDLDGSALENRLRREIAGRGVAAALRDVVVPLLSEVGSNWQTGRGQIAHEHLASAVIRAELERVRADFRPSPNAPRLLVTTPSGQVHEMGALLVSVLAAGLGWQVAYLGPNLPAEEIGAASRQLRPRAVALSMVYPLSDPQVADELRLIRREIGAGVGLIAGGGGAASYAEVLKEVGAETLDDLDSLSEALDRQTAS